MKKLFRVFLVLLLLSVIFVATVTFVVDPYSDAVSGDEPAELTFWQRISLFGRNIGMTFFYGRSRKARARTHIASLITASRAYNTQYGYWPQTATTTAMNTSGSLIVNCLKGLDTVTNPRGIVFMDFSSRDLKGSGTLQVFVDPYKNPYSIYFDTNGDNWVSSLDVGVPTTQFNGSSIQGGVVVWSWGPNRKNEWGMGDDITSWK